MMTKEEKYIVIYSRHDKKYNPNGKSICPFCGEVYRSGNKDVDECFLNHLKENHSDIYEEAYKLYIDYNTKHNKSEVECPICHEYHNQLFRHLQMKHGYKHLEDFKIGDTFIEIKSSLKNYDKNKYKYISKIMKEKGLPFEIHTCDTLCTKYNITPVPQYKLFDLIGDMLKRHACKIIYSSQYHKNSRILNSITTNYKNNPDINYNNNKGESWYENN